MRFESSLSLFISKKTEREREVFYFILDNIDRDEEGRREKIRREKEKERLINKIDPSSISAPASPITTLAV